MELIDVTIAQLDKGDITLIHNKVEFTIKRIGKEFHAIAGDGSSKTEKTLGKLKEAIKEFSWLEEIKSITLHGKVIGSVFRVDGKYFYRPKGTKGKFDGELYYSLEDVLNSIWGER